MLSKDLPLAIYMQDTLGDLDGKMGYGVIRYSSNPVACVIDSAQAGKRLNDVVHLPRDCPVVATVDEALALGSKALVLGIAPSGGRVPDSWWPVIEAALLGGMSIVNGLHDQLKPRLKHLLQSQHDGGVEPFIWDIRHVHGAPEIADGSARHLTNKRVLMVGTDMAIGKMTVGLEINKALCERGVDSQFLATGQIGITITGDGIPLDAVKVDHACGWVQQMVMNARDHDVVIIEGQGSLLHPGSSATLPLMRGANPTHLVLCHKAHTDTLESTPWVPVPPLSDVVALNETVASASGAHGSCTTIGIALNTSELDDTTARATIAETAKDTGLPVTDVIRFGVEPLIKPLL